MQQNEIIPLLKNMAWIGALRMLMTDGSGPMSLGNKTSVAPLTGGCYRLLHASHRSW